MDNEILACIKQEDIKFLHSGQISKHIFPLERKKAHETHTPHIIVRIFIIKKNDQDDIEFLVQKRSNSKKTYPGYFTDSASGHVEYQEKLSLADIKRNAFRELEEEFGISSKDVLKLHLYDLKSEKDEFTREVAYIFVGIVKSNVKLNPNKEELDIATSRFYTRSELKNILSKKNAVDYSKDIWNELLNSDLDWLFEQEKHFDKNSDKKIALFIGRFQPVHHGHIHVIYRIYETCDFLKIAIGSSQISHTKDNPFTKEERKKFIKAALKRRSIDEDKFNIYYVPDIFNANKWVEHVVSIVGKFDIVYSNSDWVRELFSNQDYKLSKKISIFKNKYNGTHIRKLISKKNQDYRMLIPNEVIKEMKKCDGLQRIQKLYTDS